MRLSSFVFPVFLGLPSFAATADQWRSRSIYQLVTDRFAQSDNSGPPCDTSARKYCGGTWQGVINHLDYIQNMGFDAIWISPVVTNINGSTPDGEAFHGYWTADFNSLNSHFGSPDDLKALSDALHQRSMYLMLDVVANHMAATALPPNYTALAPYDVASDFHAQCFITDYNNQTNVEQCWLGDNNVPLPDLNTEDQTVVDGLYAWIKNLVSENSADGLRIDTVKHIRKDFWPGFASAAGVFTLGEVLINDTNYAAPYTQVIDSVLDYPSFFTLTAAFATPQGNLSALVETAQETQSRYKNGAFDTGSFLENQDQPRFQSLTQDQSLVKNAMAWNFVTDGIPILYYGQEQGYTGGGDPNNREALWFTAYNENAPLVTHVKTLNAARKAAAAASSSYYTTAMKTVASTSSTLALSKPPMLALLTNVGNGSSASWSVPGAGYSARESLMEVISCTALQADSSGGVSANSSSGLPQVILPRSALSGSGLCGAQASHSAGGIVSAPGAVAWAALAVALTVAFMTAR